MSLVVHARLGRRTLFTIGTEGIDVPRGLIRWSQITRVTVRRSFKNRLVFGFDVTDDAPRNPLRHLARLLFLPEWSWAPTGLSEDLDAILAAIARLSPGTPIDARGL